MLVSFFFSHLNVFPSWYIDIFVLRIDMKRINTIQDFMIWVENYCLLIVPLIFFRKNLCDLLDSSPFQMCIDCLLIVPLIFCVKEVFCDLLDSSPYRFRINKTLVKLVTT